MNKEKCFNNLISSIERCNICPRMCNRKKVLSHLNGSIKSKVMFIAEAPGRLGAECTGIPLYGDVTGNNFESFLANIGWNRDEIFITNAILCNPQDEHGNNATPTDIEVENCSYYLDMVIELVNPEVIVTIGNKALEALNNICHHDISLKNSVAKLVRWNGMYVFPMYHMSPRATVHRTLIQQRSDFIALSHEVSPSAGLKKNSNKVSSRNKSSGEFSNNKLSAMVEYIVNKCKSISFFKLTKLLYLIDYHQLKNIGHTMSHCIYLRMQEGPWIPYLKNIIKEKNNIRISMDKRLILSCDTEIDSSLSKCEQEFIDQFIAKYLNSTEAEIKTAVYLTDPMKYVLRQEKDGRNMLKIPVLYKDSTVEDIDC